MLEPTRSKTSNDRLKLIRTLTAGLAHALRNPLNSATLQLAIAERRAHRLPSQSRQAVLEPLTHAREEIGRVGTLLSEFLELAVVRQLELQSVAITPLLERIAEAVRPELERRRITLELGEPSPASAFAESDALEQAITNVVDNALDAVADGGNIGISVEITNENDIAVHVDDNGPGVAPEDRARIFEPFITSKPTGSGLGLPIAQTVVTQIGGRLEVTCSPRGGARFTMHLPRG